MSDFEINPTTGLFDLVGGVIVSATAPSYATTGMFWLDTVSNNLYCYRGGDWWNIGTLDNPDIVVGVGRRSALWLLLPNIA